MDINKIIQRKLNNLENQKINLNLTLNLDQIDLETEETQENP